LRPGEYAYTDNPEAAPFRLCDVHVFYNGARLDTLHCPEEHLDSATQVAPRIHKTEERCSWQAGWPWALQPQLLMSCENPNLAAQTSTFAPCHTYHTHLQIS
jgi:hypothetical protein